MKKYFDETINTVIFDIGNVLIRFAWADYLSSFGFNETTYEHVADAMFRNEDWDAGDMGLITTQEWLQLFIDNDPAYAAQIQKVFEGFGASIIPFDFTEKWIAWLHQKKMKIYFLSNYSDEMYCQSKDALRFLEEFDGGIFSWKEKCMKPDKKIYELLLERYDINPKNAVFFDDRAENVETANQLGIHGVLFHEDIPLQMMGK